MYTLLHNIAVPLGTVVCTNLIDCHIILKKLYGYSSLALCCCVYSN